DPFDPVLPQPGAEGLVTLRGVVELQLLGTLIDRHIELAFAGVDAGAGYGMLTHLRRPFLVMRTLRSFNHPGPMKKPIAILLRTQPSRLRVGAIRRSAARLGWPPGPGRSSWNAASLSVRANTRVGKGADQTTCLTTSRAQRRAHHFVSC